MSVRGVARIALDGERLADLEDAGDDADGNESDEQKGGYEGARGNHGGEALKALCQFDAESFGDFSHALGEVAGVFTHGKDVECEVGHDRVATEG